MFFSACSPMSSKPISTFPRIALRIVGKADASGFGDPFQARGDVNAIAEDIVVVDDDVADVNSDAELDPEILRYMGILARRAALNFGRATRSIHHAGEFHQHAVARGLDDAAAMCGDGWIDEGFSDRLQPGQRSFLVGTHEAAIPGDIRSQYRCQSSFHAIDGQKLPPRLEINPTYQSMPGCRRARAKFRCG
jgi:hypothetical protein